MAQIERGLAQVQCWRDHLLTRELLQHRGQLVALSAQLRAQLQQLDQDQGDLDHMLRETDALLRNTLASGAGPPAAVPEAGGRRALP